MNLYERNEKVRAELGMLESAALNEEIEHFLSVDSEEGRAFDYYDALDQAYDLAEYHSDRKVLVPARRVLCRLGVYRTISEDEIRNTVSLGRGRKYDFQLDGVKWVFDNHLTLDK